MLHLKGFPDQLADDPTQPAEGTVLLIKEGSNVVPTNLLKGSVANLGGYVRGCLICLVLTRTIPFMEWCEQTH